MRATLEADHSDAESGAESETGVSSFKRSNPGQLAKLQLQQPPRHPLTVPGYQYLHFNATRAGGVANDTIAACVSFALARPLNPTICRPSLPHYRGQPQWNSLGSIDS